MEWIKIKRDKDGFATEESLDMMFTSLPIVVAKQYPDGCILYESICIWNSIYGWRGEIMRDVKYTHYLPIPILVNKTRKFNSLQKQVK